MGSFNATCFASRQTIAGGDPCIVVAVRQQSTFRPVEMVHRGQEHSLYGPTSSTCYPTGFWAPVSPFFEAEYDDYGRVKLRETQANLLKLLCFLEDALQYTPVVKQGENTCHDVAYDLNDFLQNQAPLVWGQLKGQSPSGAPDEQFEALFDQAVDAWDYLYGVAQQQRMFWEEHGQLRPMSFAIVHEQAWKELIDIANKQVGWDGSSREMRTVFDRALATLKARLKQIDETYARDRPERQAARKTTAFVEQFREELRRVGGFEGSRYPGELEAFYAINESFEEGKLTDDQLFEAVRPWLEVRYAVSGLAVLNLHFEPIYYAPQDYDNSIGEDFRRFVDKVCSGVVRARAAHAYGDLQSFQVCVTDLKVLMDLDKFSGDYDARVLTLTQMPDAIQPGLWRAVLETPLTEDELRARLTDFLAQRPGDTRLQPDTLQPVPPESPM